MFEGFRGIDYRVNGHNHVEIFFPQGWSFEVQSTSTALHVRIRCNDDVMFMLKDGVRTTTPATNTFPLSAVAELYEDARQYSTYMYDPQIVERWTMVDLVARAGTYLKDLG